jgi:hypothetical protein
VCQPAAVLRRQLAIVFGALMQLSVLLPTLRHFRVINVLGLVGTTYTAWFIVVSAVLHGPTAGAAARGPVSLRNFYTGFSVIMSAFGGHAMALEIMDRCVYLPPSVGSCVKLRLHVWLICPRSLPVTHHLLHTH